MMLEECSVALTTSCHKHLRNTETSSSLNVLHDSNEVTDKITNIISISNAIFLDHLPKFFNQTICHPWIKKMWQNFGIETYLK
jgi:hypothetical protein